MDRPLWVFLCPVLYWFLPHTVYRIDDEALLKRIKNVKVAKSEEGISAVGVGGISIILVNLTNPLLDYLNMGTGTIVNITIILFTLLVLIIFRTYLSKVNKTKIERTVKFNELPKEELHIWPTSIKHVLFTIFSYLFFLSCTFISGYAFIIERNALYLLSFTIMLLFFLIANAATVSMENFKVKFH